MKRIIRSILTSAAIALAGAGCAPSLINVKGIPVAQLQPISAPTAPCVAPAPIAHPHLAPIKYEDCSGFKACFTAAEWKQLIAAIGELKKESGR